MLHPWRPAEQNESFFLTAKAAPIRACSTRGSNSNYSSFSAIFVVFASSFEKSSMFYASYPCANRHYSSEERLLRPMAGEPGGVLYLSY